MIKKYLSILLIGLFVLSFTPALAAEKQEKEEKENSPAHIQKEYSELNSAINNMDKVNFEVFKKKAASALDEISELITCKPSTTNNNVEIIKAAKDKIESDKTPQQVITDEITGINAAIAMLKEMNATSKITGIDKKLADTEALAKELSSQNYKHHSMIIFRNISSAMQELCTK